MNGSRLRMHGCGFALSLGARLPSVCPWCGADLMEWLAAYRTTIDAHKLALSHEASERGAT